METGPEPEPVSDGKRQNVACDAEANQNQKDGNRKEDPLQNDVILRNLLNKCAGRDLLRFRLVSRQWNNISKPLLKNSKCRLILVYNPLGNTYTRLDSSKTLTKLNGILSTATDFPVLNFFFIWGDLGSSDAGEFFQSHGDKIKELMLDLNNQVIVLANDNDNENHNLRFENVVCIPYTRIHTLRKILMENTKHMEKLTLFSIPEEWEQNSARELFPEPRNTIQLPQITTLGLKKSNFTTPKSFRLVQDLIQAAVNLQKIKGYKIEFLDSDASAFENKIHAVRKIRFSPQEENLDLFLKFGEGAPKLEVLKISLDVLQNSGLHSTRRKKVIEILRLILESSKDTLKEISGLLPIPLLLNFKIPRMEKIAAVACSDNLEEEDIEMDPDKSKQVFLLFDFQSALINPPLYLDLELDLATSFPALHHIVFDFDASKNFEACLTCFDSALKNQQPLNSVKDVEVSYLGLSTIPFTEKLALIFPALENFTTRVALAHFQRTMSIIWKGFPNLEELDLSVCKLKDDDDEIITENLDAGITGFSPETCVQLRSNSRNVRFEDAEALRENPSICDAKKLSKLIIGLPFCSSEENQLVNPPFFSKVSGIFGFDLARKENGTKITLYSLMGKQGQVGFGEIAPYVDGYADVDFGT